MPSSILKGKNVDIHLWAPVNEVESAAIDQLRSVAALPWVHHHVSAMSDIHYGKGTTVGSVIAMKGAVAPAAVGVDIGCGVAAVRTSLLAKRLPDNLRKIRDALEAAIPVGSDGHEKTSFNSNEMPLHIKNPVKMLYARFGMLHSKIQGDELNSTRQLGTLGGGNHFLSLSVDTNKNVWILLHSGSRNIGKTLAEIHIEKAQTLEHNRLLPDRGLSVFLDGTPEMASYRNDLYWCQDYAALNRVVLLELYKNVLRSFWPGIEFHDEVHCHHNYVSEEFHYGENVLVTRKGAIRARKDELGIIPGCMGGKSFIVRGLGNLESFESASHGAGRKLSRGKAKEKFTKRDAEEQLNGVECRKDPGIFDELPRAYKNIEKVMKNQTDLVEVVTEMKEVLCVKG